MGGGRKAYGECKGVAGREIFTWVFSGFERKREEESGGWLGGFSKG